MFCTQKNFMQIFIARIKINLKNPNATVLFKEILIKT
jgi:hypothetical protein